MSGSLTITELVTPPSAQDLFDSMILWLVAQGLPADKWRPGGVARSILYVVALTFANLALLLALFAAGAYLDTATGDWLTNLARFVYGVERPLADFATGQGLAANSSGGTYVYAPGDFIVLQNDSAAHPGKAYTNVNALTLNPGDSGIVVDVVASELGTDSNAGPGDVTIMGIGDAGVSFTNPTAIVGQNEMTDANLRALCLAKLAALSMAGPRGAYAYAIQTALNAGAPVNVNRWSISPSSSTGVVTIYVASPAGPVTSDDLDAIRANIERIARPDTVTVILNSATVKPFTATFTVWARAIPGLDATTLENEVETELIDYVEAFDIGGLPKPPGTQGYIYAEGLEAAATAANAAIFSVDSSEGDLSLAAGEVASVGITVVVRFVTTPSTS